VSERLPTWTVEIGFTSSLGRQITFDAAEFDDPFIGFGSNFTQDFDGPLDDVSAHVEEITVTRGRDDLLGEMTAGQATVTLVDPEGQFGYFNPEDTSSPLAAESPGFQPMRPIRIRATLGGTVYPVYQGFLRSADYSRENKAVGRCTVTALDLFLWLSRVRPRDVEFITGTIDAGNITTGGDLVTESDAVAVETTGVSRSGVLASRSSFT
jgi:hypothetical protein